MIREWFRRLLRLRLAPDLGDLLSAKPGTPLANAAENYLRGLTNPPSTGRWPGIDKQRGEQQ